MQVQRITLVRRFTQTVFFLITGQWFLVGFLRCPFGVPFISCTNCPLGDCTGRVLQLPFIGLLRLSGLLLGRVFCGWICPLGYLHDVLGKLPKPRFEQRPWFLKIEPFLKSLKYVFLGLTLALIVLFNYPANRPYPYVVRSPSLFNPDSVLLAIRLGTARYGVRLALLAGILLAALVMTRFWCRYLCPFGAFFTILNKISLMKIERTPACRQCGKYPRECPQHTTPDTPDCIACADCIQGCPFGAIEIEQRFKHQAAERPPAPADSPSQ